MADVNTGRSVLGEFYDTVTAANDWSVRQVAERSRSRGEGISKSRVSQLVRQNPLGTISRDNIFALADGLGVSVERVALAAMQLMGFRISDAAVSPAEAIGRDPTCPKTPGRLCCPSCRVPNRGDAEHETTPVHTTQNGT